MSGGTVDSVTQDGGALYVYGGTVNNTVTQTGGTLNIDGGRVGIEQPSRSAVRYGLNLSGGTTEFNGGTIYRVYQENGEMSMSGGTVEKGYEITGGELWVSGGTIDGAYRSPAITMGGGTVTISGDAIVRSRGDGVIEYNGGTLNLNGGLIWNEHDGYYAVITPADVTPQIRFGSNKTMFIVGSTTNEDGETKPNILGVGTENSNPTWTDCIGDPCQCVERKYWYVYLPGET